MSRSEGVHRTHCCRIHGCKYGDEDCPVATGKILQAYACEECAEALWDDWDDPINILVVNARTIDLLQSAMKNTKRFLETLLDCTDGNMVEDLLTNAGDNVVCDLEIARLTLEKELRE